MDLALDCKDVKVEPFISMNQTAFIRVELTDVNPIDIDSNAKALLDVIGADACKQHFNLIEDKE